MYSQGVLVSTALADHLAVFYMRERVHYQIWSYGNVIMGNYHFKVCFRLISGLFHVHLIRYLK